MKIELNEAEIGEAVRESLERKGYTVQKLDVQADAAVIITATVEQKPKSRKRSAS